MPYDCQPTSAAESLDSLDLALVAMMSDEVRYLIIYTLHGGSIDSSNGDWFWLLHIAIVARKVLLQSARQLPGSDPPCFIEAF